MKGIDLYMLSKMIYVGMLDLEKFYSQNKTVIALNHELLNLEPLF